VTRWASLLGFVALGGLSCGGDDANPCPTGDCNLPGQTVVKWTFDNYPDRGFGGDTCIDVGASNIHVVLTNTVDPTATQTLDTDCPEGQVTANGLPAGTYTVSLTPEDSSGNPIVSAPVTAMANAPGEGMTTTVEVDVPYTAWTMAYTGTFLFDLSWDGNDCAAATPPIAKQNLTLTVNGQVAQSEETDTMHHVNGSDPEACRTLSGSAQFVKGLPFGPATLLVQGMDSTNAVVLSHQFDTFVGVGQNNPTLQFDVMPDAAPDAPPADAPAADAPPDA
jgi:hypothetical protein